MTKFKLPFMKHVEEDVRYKPVVSKFPVRSVSTFAPNLTWALDLIDISNESDKYNFVMVVVDLHSRKAFHTFLNGKTSKDIVNGFSKIVTIAKHKPRNIWSDQEGGLLSKDFKNTFPDINIYHTFGKSHSVIVERFIRTIREIINRHAGGDWERLPEIIATYNNTQHSSTKSTPNVVFQGKDNGRALFLNNFYVNKPKPNRDILQVGDRVLLSIKKHRFEKGTKQRWTDEMYKISEVLHTNPITYRVKDLHGEAITGSFYRAELQKV